ncbi:hypothetical protein FHG64_04085 [Antarcticibacterium flavum]|uniref:Glycosyltransferase RgtA/B/C/D-like domain-containing protein n=1 Tax=Antarcticibacterium flavum TaxID=2058175 RepID=A0A5B7X001_9FLAO|nr:MULTISPECIES: hypothetical protein [Antarcticibacterium]QCY68639.1 hypothetical protein FHG64_04085 [Antarcticibacterium flavum]
MKEIIELAGPEIIYLRVVNWILLFGTMLLPFAFLKVKQERWMIFFYFALALILYTPFNANILGYDTLSIFINTLLFSLTALYLRTGRMYLIPVLSFICAAAVLIRLPNILGIPLVFLFLLVIERLKLGKLNVKVLVFPGLFLGLSMLVMTAGYSIYYKTWEQFIQATSNSNSHDLLLLFSNYFRDGLKLIGFVFLIVFGFFVYRKLPSHRVVLLKDAGLFLFLVVCLLFFVGYSKFSVNYALFLVALAISFVLIQVWEGRGERISARKLILILFLFFLFINPLGSNTGLLKAYSLLLLFPFVLSISAVKEKKYWLILAAVLIPFSVVTKVFGVYEDKNLMDLEEEVKLEKLSPIHTNSERANFLKETDAAVQNLTAQGIEVFFYGDKAHIFHYLYPKTYLDLSSFFQPVDDLVFFDEIEKVLQGKESVAVFVVNSYPENSPSPLSLFELAMIKNGFEKVEDESIRYYFRIAKSEN